jgi:hypothetical protein
MSIITSINQLMTCVLADTTQVSHGIIQENDSKAVLKKLVISDLTPNMTLLGLDDGRKVKNKNGKKIMDCMSPLFAQSSNTDHNRVCDAVLIRENQNGKCDIIYIDLKSGRPQGYKGQFQSATCFMRYVQALLKEFFQEQMSIESEKYIIFHTDDSGGVTSLKKNKSRLDSTMTSPDKPKKKIVSNGDEISCQNIIRI